MDIHFKTANKEKAFKTVINIWLKDQRLYCNWCGEIFGQVPFPCCENPQVGRNLDHCRGVIEENKALRKELDNEMAMTPSMNIRYGINMPPALFNVLEAYCKIHGDKGLFAEKADLRWFMKKFPMFMVGSRV